MQKDLFTKRLISLLAIQEGLVPASVLGLPIKQSSNFIKNRLQAEGIVMPKKRRSHDK